MCRETHRTHMAAKQTSTFGMRHLTVVPSNFEGRDERAEDDDERDG